MFADFLPHFIFASDVRGGQTAVQQSLIANFSRGWNENDSTVGYYLMHAIEKMFEPYLKLPHTHSELQFY